jgi:hypothetical protein
MFYGATTGSVAGLTAHVWIQDGSDTVVRHVIALSGMNSWNYVEFAKEKL